MSLHEQVQLTEFYRGQTPGGLPFGGQHDPSSPRIPRRLLCRKGQPAMFPYPRQSALQVLNLHQDEYEATFVQSFLPFSDRLCTTFPFQRHPAIWFAPSDERPQFDGQPSGCNHSHPVCSPHLCSRLFHGCSYWSLEYHATGSRDKMSFREMSETNNEKPKVT